MGVRIYEHSFLKTNKDLEDLAEYDKFYFYRGEFMSLSDIATRAILEEALPEEEHEYIDLYQDNIHFWANRNLYFMRDWLAVTELMLRKPLEQGNLTNFYIRIFGVVIDLRERLQKQVKSLKKGFEVEDTKGLQEKVALLTDCRMINYITLLITAEETVSQIASAFNESEQMKIRFFRHLECHPMLTRLSIGLSKKGFKDIDRAKEYQRIAEQEDSLDTYQSLYPKFQKCVALIKKTEEIINSMRFS